MRRCPWPLSATFLALLLAACVDDPAVRDKLARDAAAAAASASPSAGASAAPSGAPSAPASEGPSASPVPGATGRYVPTGWPLDAAIAGPGYFVLGTRPDPQALSDLLFTRDGAFSFVFQPAASPAPGGPNAAPANSGEWRLMTRDGLYVMGWDYPGEEGTRVPAEAQGGGFPAAFTLGGPGGAAARPALIRVPGETNLNFTPGWTYRGQLWSQGRPPLDADGQPRQVFLAIAQFQSPGALQARPGSADYADPGTAGMIQAGVAGMRRAPGELPRPVGEANALQPETLER